VFYTSAIISLVVTFNAAYRFDEKPTFVTPPVSVVQLSKHPLGVCSKTDFLELSMKIDNVLGMFIIDSGSEHSSITSSFAKKLKLKVIGRSTAIIAGPNTVPSSLYQMCTLSTTNFAPFTFTPFEVDLDAINAKRKSESLYEYDGVLGCDFLHLRSVKIDLLSRTIEMSSRPLSVEGILGKWHSSYYKRGETETSAFGYVQATISKEAARISINGSVYCDGYSCTDYHPKGLILTMKNDNGLLLRGRVSYNQERDLLLLVLPQNHNTDYRQLLLNRSNSSIPS
jgi:hypothetical protein